MKSYFLENLVLNYYDTYDKTAGSTIDTELPNLFAHVYHNVHQPLYDPKGYQGDINHLTWEERNSVQARAQTDYNRANQALQFSSTGRQKESIEKWGEIFGSDFPPYINI